MEDDRPRLGRRPYPVGGWKIAPPKASVLCSMLKDRRPGRQRVSGWKMIVVLALGQFYRLQAFPLEDRRPGRRQCDYWRKQTKLYTLLVSRTVLERLGKVPSPPVVSSNFGGSMLGANSPVR